MQFIFFNTEKTVLHPYRLLFLLSFMKAIYSQPHKSLLVHRSVLLAGFHRMLQYNVTLPDISGPTHILITETLPKDVYLDPYQLSKRIEDNEIKIISDRPINSEIPAYQAQSFDIELCSTSLTNSHLIELPIHLRYQKPHDCKIHGKSVTINLADVVMRVRTHNGGISSNLCLNKEYYSSWLEEKVSLETSLLVPVGCTEDLYLVFGLTASVIVAGALYTSFMLVKSNKN